MNERNTETAASKFDDKLHKLIKRAKKERRDALALGRFQTGARPRGRSMIKVYDLGRNDSFAWSSLG